MALKGERIVVLGGSSGIGLATAQAAAREGATVVIASSRKARIDQALATLPAGTEGHVLDLADSDATQALFARLGGFDHLVFTAGETWTRHAASSRCVIGAPTVPPNMAAATFGKAARSYSLPGSRDNDRARAGPRVNIVSPGVVRTPLWGNMAEADRTALYQQMADRLPVGHVGDTAEIAEAYLYLMRQTYSTGQVLVVDGGAVLV